MVVSRVAQPCVKHAPGCRRIVVSMHRQLATSPVGPRPCHDHRANNTHQPCTAHTHTSTATLLSIGLLAHALLLQRCEPYPHTHTPCHNPRSAERTIATLEATAVAGGKGGGVAAAGGALLTPLLTSSSKAAPSSPMKGSEQAAGARLPAMHRASGILAEAGAEDKENQRRGRQ
jgi:hypothetical protein